MSSRTQAFVLLLFGGGLLRLASTEALLRFVRPVARPWILLAGVGIVLLGVWVLVSSLRGHGTDHEHSGADADSGLDAHGHSAASRAAWLVLAPVIAILVVSPPALGAYSASKVPVALPKPAQMHYPPLPAGSPTKVALFDFAVRAVFDSGRTLAGRDLSLTGFVLQAKGQTILLSRLVITCCAADARPIDVEVRLPGTPPATGTWITVTGSYAGISPQAATLPILRATTMQVVSQPADPYE